MFEALFCRLQGEVIRLVSQPEQSHERFTPQRHNEGNGLIFLRRQLTGEAPMRPDLYDQH
jgi:hypothetical protein